MKIFIYLFFIHWVADFIFQTEWMAENKSKNVLALLIHVLFYTAILLLLTAYSAILWACINGAFHFLIDYVTSKINAKLLKEKKIRAFFVSVGFDQLLHICILIFTWRINYF
jgi:hypothetical protein